MTSAGTLDFLMMDLTRHKHVYEMKDKWKILTLEKLRFGFVIWLWSCAGTVVVFITEALFWISRWKHQKSSKEIYKCIKFSKIHPIEDQMKINGLKDKNARELVLKKHELWLKNAFKVARRQQKVEGQADFCLN